MTVCEKPLSTPISRAFPSLSLPELPQHQAEQGFVAGHSKALGHFPFPGSPPTGVSGLLEGLQVPARLWGGWPGLWDSSQPGSGAGGWAAGASMAVPSARSLLPGQRVAGGPVPVPGQDGGPRGLSLGPEQRGSARSCSLLLGWGPGLGQGGGSMETSREEGLAWPGCARGSVRVCRARSTLVNAVKSS